jgi:hypothetical protein
MAGTLIAFNFETVEPINAKRCIIDNFTSFLEGDMHFTFGSAVTA